MALTYLKLTLFSFVVSSVEGLRKPGGVVGDPVPPPYPVLNVHVPEPAIGADEFKLATIARQHEQDALLSLAERIESTEKQVSATMATLALQVKKVGDLVEQQMSA